MIVIDKCDDIDSLFKHVCKKNKNFYSSSKISVWTHDFATYILTHDLHAADFLKQRKKNNIYELKYFSNLALTCILRSHLTSDQHNLALKSGI